MKMVISDIPTNAWVGLLGVIIGAILSLLGVWLTNRASIKQLQMQFQHEEYSRSSLLKRERLEELYLLIDKWLNMGCHHVLNLILVMKGMMDYNAYNDEIINNAKSTNFDFGRMQMIVDVYGHELKDAYKKLMNARDEINKIEEKHRQKYLIGKTDGSSFIEPYNKAYLHLCDVGDALKKEIAQSVRNA